MNISLCCICKKLTQDNIRKYDKYLKLFTEIIVVTNKINQLKVNDKRIKVYVHSFREDFSDLRNKALSNVKTEWVFFLDTDEEISDELFDAIPKLIENSGVEGYWLSRKTYISRYRYLKYGLFYPDYQLRLFKNNKKYKYVGVIHEHLNIDKEKTREIKLDILHYPENPKYVAFSNFSNMVPYIHLHGRELARIESIEHHLTFKSNNLSYLIATSLLSVKLLLIGFWKAKIMFISGFFRGKGFMDGWSGFRAHVLFSASILFGYLYGAKLLYLNRYKN